MKCLHLRHNVQKRTAESIHALHVDVEVMRLWIMRGKVGRASTTSIVRVGIQESFNLVRADSICKLFVGRKGAKRVVCYLGCISTKSPKSELYVEIDVQRINSQQPLPHQLPAVSRFLTREHGKLQLTFKFPSAMHVRMRFISGGSAEFNSSVIRAGWTQKLSVFYLLNGCWMSVDQKAEAGAFVCVAFTRMTLQPMTLRSILHVEAWYSRQLGALRST